MGERIPHHLPLRVAITGAQGTGKSTFGRALHTWMCQRLDPAAVFLTNLAQTVLARESGAGQRPPGALVRAFIRAHLEREARLDAPLAVLDRCLLDAAAYARVLDCLSVEEWGSLRQAMSDSMACIAAVLVVPITTDYPALAATDETPEFRRQIHEAIMEAGRTVGASMVLLSGASDADEARARELVERLWARPAAIS